MESRGTVIQGDGRQQIQEIVEELLEYGFGRLEIVFRDHKVVGIDDTRKRVRAPHLSPKRTRA